MTWYLAGPITGCEDWQCRFEKAANRLRNAGLQVVCPLDFSRRNDDWDKNMRRCLRFLTECHGLILLDGWEDSQGARLERDVALGLDMTVVEFDKLFRFQGSN